MTTSPDPSEEEIAVYDAKMAALAKRPIEELTQEEALALMTYESQVDGLYDMVPLSPEEWKRRREEHRNRQVPASHNALHPDRCTN